MLVWKPAFFVLLLALSGFASAVEEAATNEPPMDGDEEEELTPQQLEKLHAKMDADANGKLSLDEIVTLYHRYQQSIAVQNAKATIEDRDLDKDGKINLNETKEHIHPEQYDHFDEYELPKWKLADGNGDGLLDEMEVAGWLDPAFGNDNVLQHATQEMMADADENKDGLLSFDEISQQHELEYRLFKKLDTDGSGKVDMQELRSWYSGRIHNEDLMQSFIKLADTDNDQHVTIDELHAAHQNEENGAKDYFHEMARSNEL